MNAKRIVAVVVTAALGFGVAACGGTGQPTEPRSNSTGVTAQVYRPLIEPSRFTSTIDNPFLPLVPGTRRIYEGHSSGGLERIVVDVTNQTKTVMGVECVVVRDTVTVDGKVVEDTYDWFAQDSSGAVWYFGEATKKWENGSVSTKGSWEAGVDGAQPGIVMPADPQVGATYRQEFYAGRAEDMVTILSLSEKATLPVGTEEGMVMTADYTPLDPSVVEHKYFARGLGNVLVLHVKGPAERIELVRVEQI